MAWTKISDVAGENQGSCPNSGVECQIKALPVQRCIVVVRDKHTVKPVTTHVIGYRNAECGHRTVDRGIAVVLIRRRRNRWRCEVRGKFRIIHAELHGR